jgi:hypothetical protein
MMENQRFMDSIIYSKPERVEYGFVDEGLALQSTARPWTLVEPASQD